MVDLDDLFADSDSPFADEARLTLEDTPLPPPGEAELDAAVARIAARLAPASPTAAPPWRWLPVGGLGLAAAVALGLGAWWLWSSPPEPVADTTPEQVDPAPVPVPDAPSAPQLATRRTAASLAASAAALLEAGELDAAAEAYQAALDADPLHPDAAAWSKALVTIHLDRGEPGDALRVALALAHTLEPDGAWAKAHPDRFEAARDDLESALRKLALTTHAAGRTHDDPTASYSVAHGAYDAYFAAFPAGPRDAEMRYAHGELLYADGRYAEALAAYERVLFEHPDSKRAAFCGQSAIYALDKLREGGERPAPDADGVVTDPLDDRLVDVVSAYLDHFPDDSAATGLRYRAAYALYAAQRFDEAGPWLQAVIEADPGSNEAAMAANLWVDAAAVESDYAAMAERAWWVLQFEEIGGSTRAELREMGAKAEQEAMRLRGYDDADVSAWEKRWGTTFPWGSE